MAEIEAEQRQSGLVSQLRTDRGPVPVYSADFTTNGAEAVTADGIQVSRWSLKTGALLTQYGERRRGQAEDARKYGFGFLSTGVLNEGRRVLALTNGPHSLQVFGEPAAAPVLVPGDGYEGLATQGPWAAMVHSVQSRDEAVLVNTIDWRTTALPHPEVTMLRFAPNGDLLTVSRREGRWWRDGQLVRTVVMPGAAEPMAISTDARRVLMREGHSVMVWNVDRGELEFRLHAPGEPASACANRDFVFVGSQAGGVTRKELATGLAQPSIRAHLTPVTALFCGPAHVISAANNGGDTRLWRIEASPTGSVAPAMGERKPRWLVEQVLPYDLAGVTDFVRDFEDRFFIGGFVGIGAVCLLAYRTARRKPTS